MDDTLPLQHGDTLEIKYDDWFPTEVVLAAVNHWSREAKAETCPEKLEMAIRWCRWQYMKTVDNVEKHDLAKLFNRYHRSWRFCGQPVGEPPNCMIDEASEADIGHLSADLSAMESFLSAYSRRQAPEEVTLLKERDVWGGTNKPTPNYPHFLGLGGLFSAPRQ